MITAITLENFKGIRESTTIPMRPLTVMFGKNSAGKSTVVQALHYAREIFERDNLNPDRTMYGGSSVDLGGFRNLVNNHDEQKAITMRFKMDLELYKTDLPEYDFSPTLAYQAIKAEQERRGKDKAELTNERLNTLTGQIKSAEIELKIEFSDLMEQPILTNYKVRLNEIEAVQVLTSLDGMDVYVEFNGNHRLLNADEDSEQINTSNVAWQRVKLKDYKKTLPDKGSVLVLDASTSDEYVVIDDILLTQMLVGPTDLLREWLSGFRYVGPLRVLPPRNFQPSLTEEEADWSNGVAAWRVLYDDEAFLEFIVNVWLLENLKTGYRVELKQFREIPLNSPLMIALSNNTVFDDIADTAIAIRHYPIQKKLVLIEEKSGLEVLPHDIGVGISQVVPVVVAAADSANRIIAIEQPELHLHPAMQAELGDLFIESALGNQKNFFLIETHSEHLILRILRRIREATRGKNEYEPNITPEDVSLLYVGDNNQQTSFLYLRIDRNGRIIDRVPGGFFEEDFAEIF